MISYSEKIDGMEKRAAMDNLDRLIMDFAIAAGVSEHKNLVTHVIKNTRFQTLIKGKKKEVSKLKIILDLASRAIFRAAIADMGEFEKKVSVARRLGIDPQRASEKVREHRLSWGDK